jgi:transposase
LGRLLLRQPYPPIPFIWRSGARGGSRTTRRIHELYIYILLYFLQPKDIFMQDNSPLYISRLVRGLLEDLMVEVIEWPPYSPNLKLIENLWALLK